jgi:ketosteroid isomerase-like protein
MTDSHPHVEVARALTERLLAGDVAGVADLYHDDALVWRNLDDRALVKKQMIKVVTFLSTSVKDTRYSNIRVQATETGFVQQHVLEGIAPSGEPVRAFACLVATIRDGKIARLDEYLDSAQLAPLMK